MANTYTKYRNDCERFYLSFLESRIEHCKLYGCEQIVLSIDDAMEYIGHFDYSEEQLHAMLQELYWVLPDNVNLGEVYVHADNVVINIDLSIFYEECENEIAQQKYDRNGF